MRFTTHFYEFEKPIPDPQSQIDKAIELYETMLAQERGKIVFVAGDTGSGRTEVLGAIAEHFSKIKSAPHVIYGRFSNSKYESILPRVNLSVPTGADAVGNSLSGLAKILAIKGIPAGLVVEGMDVICDFVGQMLQTGASVHNALTELSQSSASAAMLASWMKRLLRQVAEEKPVVCLFDDFDEARGFEWLQFLNCFADEINIDVPLLFFISLKGKATFSEHKQGEPESGLENIMRRLVKDQLAEWWHLPPMTREEIAKWIGLDTALGIVSQLHGVTGGIPRWVRLCWRDWKQKEAVYYNEAERCWKWSVKNKPDLDLFNDILGERIGAILQQRGLNPHDQTMQAEFFNRYNEIKQILGVAALEGEKFTADAIALAIGWDRDKLIDFFDDELVQTEQTPNGVLREEDFFTIEITPDNLNNLCRFSFVTDWFWLVTHRYASNEKAMPQKTADLITALQHVYKGEEQQIAATLARLCRLIKDDELANRYQIMADFHGKRETLHNIALNILNQNSDTWDEAKCRYTARFLFESGEAMFKFYSFPETARVFNFAATLAHRGGEELIQAHCLFFSSNCYSSFGENSTAKAKAKQALSIYNKKHSQHGIAKTSRLLGKIAFIEERFLEARDFAERALEHFQRINNKDGISSTILLLSLIATKENLDEARNQAKRALEIDEERDNKEGIASSLTALCDISLLEGRLNEARRYAVRALEIDEERGDKDGIAGSLFLLGVIALKEDKLDEAHTFTVKAYKIYEELNNANGFMASINVLADIAVRRMN